MTHSVNIRCHFRDLKQQIDWFTPDFSGSFPGIETPLRILHSKHSSIGGREHLEIVASAPSGANFTRASSLPTMSQLESGIVDPGYPCRWPISGFAVRGPEIQAVLTA